MSALWSALSPSTSVACVSFSSLSFETWSLFSFSLSFLVFLSSLSSLSIFVLIFVTTSSICAFDQADCVTGKDRAPLISDSHVVLSDLL